MRNHCTARPIPLLLLLCATSCRDAPTPTPGVTVSDSAGVTVLRHGEEAIVHAPAISVEEVVRIGSLDGAPETQFFRLSHAIQDEGEIFVLDAGDHEIRVFDTDGTFIRSLGGEGDGPGEFRDPWGFSIVGDTVAVIGSRLTILDREGEPLGSGPGRAFADTGYLAYTMATKKGWRGYGSTRRSTTVPRGAPFRETDTIYEVDPHTAAIERAVFSFEREEVRLVGEAGWILEPFFQAPPMLTIGRDGDIYYTPGGTYRIDVIDGDSGDLVRRTTGEYEGVPVTDDLRERALRSERERLADAPPGSEMAMYADVIERKAALDGPSTLPVFGQMHASETGWLLALRPDLDADPVESGNRSVWDLFDPDGRLHGRLELPPGVRVLSLTDDGLLAVARDELDVQSLVKYRFVLE